ncbi:MULTISPECIES: hypothetical protein [Gemella]|uniref:hypothetical protein n=1 Tax=Gemella TaxID=1378 RepID=UPI00076844DE|nr:MULTISPECIES: hypothetical protein [Gemella]AME09356.1 hypothetical protein AXE85_03930 [Gemella sp. oral taxon 928]AXI26992.1 hypothetical protein CG018_06060 [Gemella sp. ND 6198]
MTRFLKIFITLTIITAIGLGIFYYINNSSKDNNTVDDKTNIETTVKSETGSQEDVEGTVVAKRSTENN